MKMSLELIEVKLHHTALKHLLYKMTSREIALKHVKSDLHIPRKEVANRIVTTSLSAF